MDTKLKNGKKNRALWTGILITILAAGFFVVMLPEFERKASAYYEASINSAVEGESFVSSLIQCNYVLYKNIMDKTDNKVYSYEELYLSEDLQDVTKETDDEKNNENISESVRNDTGKKTDIGQLNSIRSMYTDLVQKQAIKAENMYIDDIGQKMDYYVLKKSAGTILKNTALPIETLLDTLGSADTVKDDDENAVKVNDYVYYVIMDYDAAGNLQNISVRGEDAD